MQQMNNGQRTNAVAAEMLQSVGAKSEAICVGTTEVQHF